MKSITQRSFKIILTLYILLANLDPLVGQVMTLKSGPIIDQKILRGHSREVQVTDARGNLQWQISNDGISWVIWAGKTEKSLTVVVNNIIFLRCAIQEGKCDRVYSDALKLIPYELASVATNTVKEIQKYSAVGGGLIITDGGDPIQQRGVCWSVDPFPTLTDSKTIEGEGIGSYTSAITGLTPGTHYYVRAYATNSAGTAYGQHLSFITEYDITLPEVTTSAISGITQVTASSGGTITSDGRSAITARGVCWSNSSNPTISDSKTSDGADMGSFISSLTGLTGNTTYFVRAYATNSAGTSYGNAVGFQTSPVLPAVITTAISSVSQTTAISGGIITSDGGGSITARGICWSTSSNPTISDSKTSDGSGTGIFTSSLAGLTGNKTYFVRAYATNSAGTSYGNQISFKTNPLLPEVTTSAISNITQTTAAAGGYITSDGGASITGRGVCWAHEADVPDLDHAHTTDGTGTGLFMSNLTGLTANTRYVARAYATNSVGTSYGLPTYFRTGPFLPSVTTAAVIDITQTTASSGGIINNDGYADITARGVCWSTIQNPTTAGSKTSDGTGIGSFSSRLAGLTASTTYFVRAYAITNSGTVYGNEITFFTGSNISQPTVTTKPISAITQTSATGGGNVTSDGGDPVVSRGVCWGTSQNPTIADFITSDGAGTDEYVSSLGGLSANTSYYVRAYATNSAGTSYGNQVNFSTLPAITEGIPTVSTSDVSNITLTTAVCCGIIQGLGDGNITGIGFCLSTSPNPTTANRVVDVRLSPYLVGYIEGLVGNTTYFVRAFIKNSKGTGYGQEISFKTKKTDSEISNNVLVIDGDSRALGFDCTSQYPWLHLLKLEKTFDVYNAASGGLSTAEFIAKTNVDPHLTGSAPVNIVVMWAGNIDVALEKCFLPAIIPYNNLVKYCNMRKAKGWKVIICTEISAGGTGPYGASDVLRAELNDYIRANWQQFADGLADLGSHESIGILGAYNNTSFFCDYLHLTHAGTACVADVISNAVNVLMKH